MKKAFLITLTALCMCLNQVDSKQRIAPPHRVAFNPDVEHTHTRRQRSPIVGQNIDAESIENGLDLSGYSTTCQEECLFADDNNRWCLQTSSPMLTAGWQIEQTSDTSTFWTIQLQPYLETQLSLVSSLILNRLYSQQIDIGMSKFKAYFYYGFGFWYKGTVCTNFGFSTGTDPAIVLIKMYYNFINCYKTVFNDLNDFSTQWTGADSKYIDECETSYPSELTLSSFQLFPTASPYSFWGGDPTGVNQTGCFEFGQFNEWAPYYAGLAFKAANYAGIIPNNFELPYTKPSENAEGVQANPSGELKSMTHHGGTIYSDKNKKPPTGKECKKMRQYKKKY